MMTTTKKRILKDNAEALARALDKVLEHNSHTQELLRNARDALNVVLVSISEIVPENTEEICS